MYIGRYNLNYSLNSKIGFLSAEISHDRYRNCQTGIIYQDSLNGRIATISEQANISEGRDWSGSLSGNLKPLPRLMINPYFRLTHQYNFTPVEEYKSDYPERTNWYWNGSIYAQFSLSKTISLSCYANYNGPSIAGYTDNGVSYFYMLGFDWRILKDQGKLGINWYLPLSSKFTYSRSSTKTATLEQNTLGSFVYDYVAQISFS
jgi:hypothetical protein